MTLTDSYTQADVDDLAAFLLAQDRGHCLGPEWYESEARSILFHLAKRGVSFSKKRDSEDLAPEAG